MVNGNDLVVVASRAGSDATPMWWLNLKATRRATVQVGAEGREVLARESTKEEKEILWPRLIQMYDDYALYQRRTDRDIPVIILSPAA